MATMPRNKASDARAMASSATARTMKLSRQKEQDKNIVPFMFQNVKRPAMGRIPVHQIGLMGRPQGSESPLELPECDGSAGTLLQKPRSSAVAMHRRQVTKRNWCRRHASRSLQPRTIAAMRRPI
jgi:hypothetical protein